MLVRPTLRMALVGVLACLWLSPGAQAASYHYPFVPFAMGGPGTLLTSGAGDLWAGDLWVAQPGVLREVAPRPDGSLGVIQTVGLPEGTVPVAVADSQPAFFVLDAAGEALLAFPRSPPGGPPVWGSPVRLPVGSKPSAVTVGAGGPDNNIVNYVAVANSGSGDLSVYTWKGDSVSDFTRSLSGQRRVPVGGHPVAFSFIRDDSDRLVVAGGVDGTVSLLNPGKGFAREAQIAVGGVASDVVWDNLGELWGRQGSHPALMVADASGPRVHVLLASGSGFEPDRVLQLAPNATADALAIADLNADGSDDVIVADRATKSVIVFYGRGDGRFGPPRTVRSGLDPVALLAGDFGGDWQHPDLAVADASTNEVSLILTPGDPQVVPGVQAQNLSSDAGVLTWSHAAGKGSYRLALRRAGTAADLPIEASSKPFVPRVGRLAPGRPAIAYVACRRSRCAPKVWDLTAARERPLAIKIPAACRLDAVAVWDSHIAYDVQAASRRCPATAPGLWLRSGRARAVRRTTGHLGDLRDGFLTWFAPYFTHNDRGALIQVARPGKPARTIGGVSIDCHCWLEPPTITHHTLVYGINNSDSAPGGIDLYRLPLGHRGACQQVFSGDLSHSPRMAVPVSPAASVQFTIDGNSVFYTDAPGDRAYSASGGIFQVDPARERWTRDCTLTRW